MNLKTILTKHKNTIKQIFFLENLKVKSVVMLFKTKCCRLNEFSINFVLCKLLSCECFLFSTFIECFSSSELWWWTNWFEWKSETCDQQNEFLKQQVSCVAFFESEKFLRLRRQKHFWCLVVKRFLDWILRLTIMRLYQKRETRVNKFTANWRRFMIVQREVEFSKNNFSLRIFQDKSWSFSRDKRGRKSCYFSIYLFNQTHSKCIFYLEMCSIIIYVIN